MAISLKCQSGNFCAFLTLSILGTVCLFAGCKEPGASDTAGDSAAQKDGPVEMERVKAEVGVAKQGRVIGDKQGFLRTPAKALIDTKQRVAYEFQVKHAVDLYEGEHGYKPKTHEEFMEKIIEFNGIKLPELPEGHTYIWDPEVGELMVERPKE